MKLPALPLLWLPVMAAAQTAALPADAVSRATALAHDAAVRLAATQAPAGARVQVEAGTLDPRLNLAPCTKVEPFLAAGAPAWGRTRVGLRCADAGVRWQVFLPLTVQVWAPALAATAALPAGALIDASQWAAAPADWAAAATPPIADARAVEGRVLARPVAAGQPLRAGDLKPRQWFAAGDLVQVLASGAGFAVNAEAQALGPGFEGQPARVRTEAGRVLVGRPVGERRVEVAL